MPCQTFPIKLTKFPVFYHQRRCLILIVNKSVRKFIRKFSNYLWFTGFHFFENIPLP